MNVPVAASSTFYCDGSGGVNLDYLHIYIYISRFCALNLQYSVFASCSLGMTIPANCHTQCAAPGVSFNKLIFRMFSRSCRCFRMCLWLFLKAGTH